MMQLSYIPMGMFLDDTAMLVIVAPPFGYNLFLMRAMAPSEVTIGDIYRSIVPFVLVMCLGLALVMIFPQIALWLPQWHYGR